MEVAAKLPARLGLGARGVWLDGDFRTSDWDHASDAVTVLRLLAYAGLVLVAAVLAWRALTLWTMKESFVGGAIGLFTTTMLGLAVLSPDAYIAKQNMQGPRVDAWYLLSLSDDALPALLEGHQKVLSEAAWQDQYGPLLATRAERLGASESWLTWNLGRARARAALAQYAPK